MIWYIKGGENHDNKIVLQVNFNPTAANIMDLLCIFVITKQYLFQHVSALAARVIFVLILYKYFFHLYHELFFSGTLNYFSNMYRELFFAVS